MIWQQSCTVDLFRLPKTGRLADTLGNVRRVRYCFHIYLSINLPYGYQTNKLAMNSNVNVVRFSVPNHQLWDGRCTSGPPGSDQSEAADVSEAFG